MKPKSPSMHWRDEIEEKGTESALLDRLRFHKGMFLTEVELLAGLSHQTIRRHLNRLIAKGFCIQRYINDREYYEITSSGRE